jgi:hypothetical protein
MHPGFLFLTIAIALLSIVSDDLSYKCLEIIKDFSIITTSRAKAPFSSVFSSGEFSNVPIPENMTTRAIRKVFLAIEQGEGAGARVRQSIGGPQLRELSPFLMLDHFSSTSLAGFPDHSHRGQGASHKV